MEESKNEISNLQIVQNMLWQRHLPSGALFEVLGVAIGLHSWERGGRKEEGGWRLLSHKPHKPYFVSAPLPWGSQAGVKGRE